MAQTGLRDVGDIEVASIERLVGGESRVRLLQVRLKGLRWWRWWSDGVKRIGSRSVG